MSLMQKLFGIAPAQQQQQQQPQQTPAQAPAPVNPGNLPAQQQMPAAANNPTVPAATVNATANTPNNGDQTQAPTLDTFKDMWNLTDAQKPKTPDSPFAGVTPEAIQKVAGNTDFSKVVTPELLAKISAGGDEAAAAMMTAMNQVAQQTYAQSAQAAIKLTETAATSQREQIMAQLPDLIKQHTVANNLRTKNPIFDHPAAKPMLDSIATQLQLKNPTATADQIQQQAEQFLIGFANAANPQKPQTQQTIAHKGSDFSDWV